MIYVIVENGVIVNRVICDDPAFAQAQGWIQADEYSIGMIQDGETFIAPVPVE